MGSQPSKHSNSYLLVKAFLQNCEIEVLTNRSVDATAVFHYESKEEIQNLIKKNTKYIKDLKRDGYKVSAQEILKHIHYKLDMMNE